MLASNSLNLSEEVTDAEIAFISDYIVGNANSEHKRKAVRFVKSVGLDPRRDEVNFFINSERNTFMPYPTLKGWLRIILDNPNFAGIIKVEWLNERDQWVEFGDLGTSQRRKFPRACRVYVKNRKLDCATVGYAQLLSCTKLTKEGVPTSHVWYAYTDQMTKKVAFINACRFAFPLLVNFYSEDEVIHVAEQQGYKIDPKDDGANSSAVIDNAATEIRNTTTKPQAIIDTLSKVQRCIDLCAGMVLPADEFESVMGIKKSGITSLEIFNSILGNVVGEIWYTGRYAPILEAINEHKANLSITDLQSIAISLAFITQRNNILLTIQDPSFSNESLSVSDKVFIESYKKDADTKPLSSESLNWIERANRIIDVVNRFKNS